MTCPLKIVILNIEWASLYSYAHKGFCFKKTLNMLNFLPQRSRNFFFQIPPFILIKNFRKKFMNPQFLGETAVELKVRDLQTIRIVIAVNERYFFTGF